MMEINFLAGPLVTQRGETVLIKREHAQIGNQEEKIYNQDSEKNVVKDVAQRNCGQPMLGSIQGQGWMGL